MYYLRILSKNDNNKEKLNKSWCELLSKCSSFKIPTKIMSKLTKNIYEWGLYFTWSLTKLLALYSQYYHLVVIWSKSSHCWKFSAIISTKYSKNAVISFCFVFSLSIGLYIIRNIWKRYLINIQTLGKILSELRCYANTKWKKPFWTKRVL